MPWVDIAEAAFTLGVSERTIRNWIKTGKIEARNISGRREVHIQEDHMNSANGAGAGFGDDEGEDGLGVQKRLEVALIECGRVKGTLASQERMMESLSANIAELNAKLQKSERTIGQRTMYILAIGFIGLLAVVGVLFYDQQKLDNAYSNFSDEKRTLEKDKQQTVIDMQNKLIEDREKNETRFQEEMTVLREKLNQEKLKAVQQVKQEEEARWLREVERIQTRLDQAILERDQLKESNVRTDEQLRRAKADLEAGETKIADLESELELLKRQNEELKLANQSLQGGSMR